jgi:hypothetical protein
MWECLVELAKVAPIITALVAALGVYVAFTQLRNNRVNQRETTAKGIFREYLKLAFENPQFAEPNYQELKKDREEFSRYSWL